MKRYLAIISAAALALTLASCDVYAKAGGSSSSGSSSIPDSSGAPEASSAAEQLVSALPESGSQPEEDHSHQPAQADNIVPHEQMLYCGNTVTTVSQNGRLVEDPPEVSFWGDDSIALTDLLIHLNYSGDICRCLPEYEVTTEFSEESYGVNLSEGYARYNGGQVTLTEEQVELIRDILDRNMPG